MALKREDEYYLPEFQIPVSGSAGIYRAVLLNVSPTGEFLSWKRLGNSSYEHRVNRVHVDAQNDVLLTGWFEVRFEFDPAPALETLMLAPSFCSSSLS